MARGWSRGRVRLWLSGNCRCFLLFWFGSVRFTRWIARTREREREREKERERKRGRLREQPYSGRELLSVLWHSERGVWNKPGPESMLTAGPQQHSQPGQGRPHRGHSRGAGPAGQEARPAYHRDAGRHCQVRRLLQGMNKTELIHFSPASLPSRSLHYGSCVVNSIE